MRVAAFGKAHLRAGIVQPNLKRFAVQIAGALVEQPGHQIGQPFFAGRILRAATLEGESGRR